MATTPNLGLHKPARTDIVSVVTDINNNMDTLDSKIGAVPAGHDVEEQITTIKTGTWVNFTQAESPGIAFDNNNFATNGLPMFPFLFIISFISSSLNTIL